MFLGLLAGRGTSKKRQNTCKIEYTQTSIELHVKQNLILMNLWVYKHNSGWTEDKILQKTVKRFDGNIK